MAQNFAGGKIFFSPATGANAVETDILTKYEALGGPAKSDLGFPISNEADGGLKPASKISAFSANDKPVIFWTADHGAYVVRGRDQSRMGQTPRADRQTGRTAGRPDGRQRCRHAEVHRRPDRLEPVEEHLHHTTGEPGVGAVRSRRYPAGRPRPVRRRPTLRRLAGGALVVVAGGAARTVADRRARAAGAVVASASRCQARRQSRRDPTTRTTPVTRPPRSRSHSGRRRPTANLASSSLAAGLPAAASADRARCPVSRQHVDAAGPQSLVDELLEETKPTRREELSDFGDFDHEDDLSTRRRRPFRRCRAFRRSALRRRAFRRGSRRRRHGSDRDSDRRLTLQPGGMRRQTATTTTTLR